MEFQFYPIEKSFLTIITATYNSSKYISICLETLKNCCKSVTTKQRISHIVVDGNSTDNTVELIKEISPHSTVVYRSPCGIYDALNYGISLVRSPYVMYLHSDDELEERFLEEMFLAIYKTSKVEGNFIFYSSVDFISPHSNLLFSRKPPVYIPMAQKYVSVIYHPNAIYSTILEKTCPYPVDKGLNADQLHLAEIAKGAKLIRVPKARYKFRFSNESRSLTHRLTDQKRNHDFRKIFVNLFQLYIYYFDSDFLIKFWLKITGKSYFNTIIKPMINNIIIEQRTNRQCN